MCQAFRMLPGLVMLFICGSVHAQKPDDPPAWMRDAVIYGIKPSTFVDHGGFADMTAKLSDLGALGVNTIWLQPVYRTARGGQGYDVTDFFSLREDLGDSNNLHEFIREAKRMRMRVLFDFVPNHTSLDHPYAIDVIRNGRSSPYYSFYQHQIDSAPYHRFYHTDDNGFVYYFWKNLVNLDYSNERVQEMIIEACKYWMTAYGLDGFRFDAMWAVSARAPRFGRRLRAALRAVNPEVLLLAEDKGSRSEVYQGGYDAAYDWATDSNWVSKWNWQYHYDARKSFTIFNCPDTPDRKRMLEEAIFSNGENAFRLLRFIENNDLPRFIVDHSPAQTRMAAALEFSLPGIPLVFCGQEIGSRAHPYSRKPIFDARRTIREQDSAGLFTYYQRLIAGRRSLPALTSRRITRIPNDNPYVVSFIRGDSSPVLVLLNLSEKPATVRIAANDLQRLKLKDLEDVLTGTRMRLKRSGVIVLPGSGIVWLSAARAVHRNHSRM